MPFQSKSTWVPPSKLIHPKTMECISNIEDDIKNIKVVAEKPNIQGNQFKAMYSLKNNKKIIIKKADKGSAVVVLNKSNYLEEGYRQLNNENYYTKLTTSIYQETALKIEKILQELLDDKIITKRQYNFLAPAPNPRPRYFYMLPKIHKPPDTWPNQFMPPGRPIISDCASESKNISKFIDFYLKPHAITHPSYIKDTNDFLNKLKKIDISPDDLIATLDVDNMYTNIDIEDGIRAIKEKLGFEHNNKRTLAIIALLELSLKNNDFIFNNDIFLQTCGTAMGKDYAPNYSNIFMAKWEMSALEKCVLKPKLFLRYLDDIFIIWPHGREAFQIFFETINTHHPSIKLKYTISNSSINFLDTTIVKQIVLDKYCLISKVYFKPTDTHELLDKRSFHPRHTFSGVIKSQIMRFKRICTLDKHFEEACKILFDALKLRNYSKRWLRKIKNDTIRIMTRKLVTTEIEIPGPSTGGCDTCDGIQCKTCEFLTPCHNFFGYNEELIHPITSELTCSSRNIIYLITCQLCFDQYVGETENSLRERWAKHRTDIKYGKFTNSVAKHLDKYHSKDYRFDVLTIIPIEQIPIGANHTCSKAQREVREQFWIDKLKTFSPFGMNEDYKHPKNRNNPKIPFIVPFSKTANRVSKLVKQHYKDTLQEDEDNKLIEHDIIVAYSRHKNLSDFLVSSKHI